MLVPDTAVARPKPATPGPHGLTGEEATTSGGLSVVALNRSEVL
jgi:hypothetical protein